MSEWIKCSDRLPEATFISRSQLVFFSSGDYGIAERELDGTWWDGHRNIAVDEVTHWMPLPAEPEIL